VLHRLALAFFSEKRLDARLQLLRRDDRRGARIAQQMLELGCRVHAVDGHDRGVGAQDAVVGDYELRAVVHEQRHAVAAPHAAFLLQETRDRFAALLELPVVGRGAAKGEGGAAREARRRNLEVVPERSFGNREMEREAAREE
jgi:hypothetical protein